MGVNCLVIVGDIVAVNCLVAVGVGVQVAGFPVADEQAGVLVLVGVNFLVGVRVGVQVGKLPAVDEHGGLVYVRVGVSVNFVGVGVRV